MGDNRILQLCEALRALKDGNISALPPVPGDDEIARLAATLNEVLASAHRSQNAIRDERSRFIGAAAHDLRNPLAALKGFLSVLQENRAEASPEEHQVLLQAEHAADALFALLLDMEDISALDHSKFSLTLYPTPVTPFLLDCVQHFDEDAKRKQIRLETKRSEVKMIVCFDPEQTKQAIGQLIKNAIAFSPAGGTATIAASRQDSMLRFSVTDQGPGIPAAEISSLFKDFARISVRPTGGEHTTRLGLGIVRRIVEAHGGSTQVQSAPGQGSTFTILLPWKEDAAP